MSFDVYSEIQQHAPNHAATAAGNLHEEIWSALLHRSDPNFHNVRVTRGDGGIDGIVFVDAATGIARVYQAKFYGDLSAKPTSDHQDLVADSFARAHCHKFVCTTWILLFPKQLSHTELNWLMCEMKAAAKAKAKSLPKAPPDVDARMDTCAIEYRDADNLNALLAEHLDIAATHLPRSSLALMQQVTEQKKNMARQETEMAGLLRHLRDEAIRSHQIETRRSRAALEILAQGWSNEMGMLKIALITKGGVGKPLKDIAAEVELVAAGRAEHAYQCEGLVPGASALVAGIHRDARILQLANLAANLGATGAEAEEVVARRILERIESLQSLIDKAASLTRS